MKSKANKKVLMQLVMHKRRLVDVCLKYYLLLCFLFLLSCDSNRIYNEFNSDFENNRWISNEAKEFSFSIDEDEIVDLKLHLGHIYDFQFASVPMQIAITYPDGHTESIPIDLMIKNQKGEDIADCTGDICDLYYTFKNNVTFPKGDYLVIVTNTFSGAYLPNILGIGIQVEK